MSKKLKLETILPTVKEVLVENNIPFEVKNNGYHVIINIKKNRFDYWPTSGRFTVNHDFKNISSGGLTELVKAVNQIQSYSESDLDTIFFKDIEEMEKDELKKTVYLITDYVNKIKKNN